MHSSSLVEYMRHGTIAPLVKGDSKRDVEAKLGPPEDWKGRVGGIGWDGPLLSDYHESWAWHYGSLCVTFPDVNLYGVPGVSLSYSTILKPIRFPSPFSELPPSPFSIEQLADLLRRYDVRFDQPEAGESYNLLSAGGIAVVAQRGICEYFHPNTKNA
jgi:hypothetical protein